MGERVRGIRIRVRGARGVRVCDAGLPRACALGRHVHRREPICCESEGMLAALAVFVPCVCARARARSLTSSGTTTSITSTATLK